MIYKRRKKFSLFLMKEAAVPMVFIREADLPMSIRGFIMPDADGNYNIYINNKLSEERRKLTIEHELKHLSQGDCYSELPVQVIESNLITA